jgi:hypothetical protein
MWFGVKKDQIVTENYDELRNFVTVEFSFRPQIIRLLV